MLVASTGTKGVRRRVSVKHSVSQGHPSRHFHPSTVDGLSLIPLEKRLYPYIRVETRLLQFLAFFFFFVCAAAVCCTCQHQSTSTAAAADRGGHSRAAASSQNQGCGEIGFLCLAFSMGS